MIVVPVDQQINAIIRECFARRTSILIIFIIISITLLSIGSKWPKRYLSSTVIEVDNSNILKPLMKGAAETTKPNDKIANAREIILGDTIMDQVLVRAEWLNDDLTDVDKERLKNDIKAGITISDIGDNLIKIEYYNSDPVPAYKTTKVLGDLFIEEGMNEKINESQSAYDFIETQVQNYLEKLTKVEDDLRRFRSENPESHPGLEAEISNNVTRLQREIKKNELLLRETRIKKKSIEKQLSGEAAITISQSKEGIYRAKIADLQSRLETLRLDYKETYPDITRTKNQISDLIKAMNSEVSDRGNAIAQANKDGSSYIDNAILLSPLYQQLRSDSSNTETEIATLKARITELKSMLEQEYGRVRKVHGGEAVLARLTRNYEVNRGIYQDLLKRQENARVSKTIDEEQKGLSFRIQEPAKMALLPTGLRFLHFAIAGLVLGLLIPVGLIYVMFQLDPRVRFSQSISSELNIPILAELDSACDFESREFKKNIVTLSSGILFVFIIYGLVGWLKFTGQL